MYGIVLVRHLECCLVARAAWCLHKQCLPGAYQDLPWFVCVAACLLFAPPVARLEDYQVCAQDFQASGQVYPHAA